MPPLLQELGNFILNHYEWRYFLIAGGMFIHWEITLILSMYLVLGNYVGWGGFLLAIFAGSFGYEAALYSLGRLAKGSRLGAFIERKIPNHRKIEHILNEHAQSLLFFSKFVAYLNSAVIVLAGWTKMPVLKFAKTRILATLFWFFLFGAITYSFLSGYELINQAKIFRNLELVVFALILAILFGSKRLVKKLLWKTTSFEEKTEALGEKIETAARGLENDPTEIKND